MRIKIVRSARARVVDGVDLRRFIPGQKYDVGSQLGALLLAEGWAEPIVNDEPALIVPFSDNAPFEPPRVVRDSPPSPVRETRRRPVGDRSLAADFERRRSRRKRSH